jgi:flagellar biosynthesis chaperone FliJ
MDANNQMLFAQIQSTQKQISFLTKSIKDLTERVIELTTSVQEMQNDLENNQESSYEEVKKKVTPTWPSVTVVDTKQRKNSNNLKN